MGNGMIAVASVSSILGGTVLTCVAERFPRLTKQCDLVGASFFLFGLFLVGSALPLFR